MSKYSRNVKSHKRKISFDINLGRQVLKCNPKYIGNPQHKKNPGNFGLTPPCCAIAKKNLCDEVGIFDRHIAQQLLEEGLRRGLLSRDMCHGWPCNIWAVSEEKTPLEARLDQASGTYHGFPLSKNDPLYAEILIHWENSHE